MAEKPISEKDQIRMSKRAYLKACLNVALQTGKDKETAAAMAKKAAEWREKRFSPEVQAITEKRASQLKKLILERKASA